MGTRKKAEVDLEAPRLSKTIPFHTAEQKRKWQAYIDAVGQVGPSWAKKIRRTYLKYGKDDVRNVYLEICRSVRLEKDRRIRKAAREEAGASSVQDEQHDERTKRPEKDLLLNTAGIDQLSVPNSLHSGLSPASVHPSDQASHSSKSLATTEESLKQEQLDRHFSRREPLARARVSTEGGPADNIRTSDAANYGDIPEERPWFNQHPDVRKDSPELQAPPRTAKTRQVSEELAIPSSKGTKRTATSHVSHAVSSSSSSSHTARQSLQPETSLSDAELDALIYAGIPEEHFNIQFDASDVFLMPSGQQPFDNKENTAVNESFGNLSDLGCRDVQSTSLVEGQASTSSKEQSEVYRSLPAAHVGMQTATSSLPLDGYVAAPFKQGIAQSDQGTVNPVLFSSSAPDNPLPAMESFSTAGQAMHAIEEDRSQDEDSRTRTEAAALPLSPRGIHLGGPSSPTMPADGVSMQPPQQNERMSPVSASAASVAVPVAAEVRRSRSASQELPEPPSGRKLQGRGPTGLAAIGLRAPQTVYNDGAIRTAVETKGVVLPMTLVISSATHAPASKSASAIRQDEDSISQDHMHMGVAAITKGSRPSISHQDQGTMPLTRADASDLSKNVQVCEDEEALQSSNLPQYDSSQPLAQILQQNGQPAGTMQVAVELSPARQATIRISLSPEADSTRENSTERKQSHVSSVKQESNGAGFDNAFAGSPKKASILPESPALIKAEPSTPSYQPAFDSAVQNLVTETRIPLKSLRLHASVVQAFANMGWETVHDVWESGTDAEEIVNVIKDLEQDGTLKKGPVIGAISTMTKVLKAYESTGQVA